LENYKTIKELADDWNVTKQSIQYHLKKLPPNLSVKNIDGKILLNKDIIEYLSTKIKIKRDKKSNMPTEKYNFTDKKIEKDNLNKSDENITLKDTIKRQSKIIDELFERQKSIEKLLDQQQQLTLQSNKQIEQLQQQLVLTTQKQETEGEQKEEKKNLNEELEQAENSKIDPQPLDKKWWQFWK